MRTAPTSEPECPNGTCPRGACPGTVPTRGRLHDPPAKRLDVDKPIATRRLDLNLLLERVAKRAGDLDAIVIDEFQNISNPVVQTQIIEVVKGFSDKDVGIHIVVAGVVDSDDEPLTSTQYDATRADTSLLTVSCA